MVFVDVARGRSAMSAEVKPRQQKRRHWWKESLMITESAGMSLVYCAVSRERAALTLLAGRGTFSPAFWQRGLIRRRRWNRRRHGEIYCGRELLAGGGVLGGGGRGAGLRWGGGGFCANPERGPQ